MHYPFEEGKAGRLLDRHMKSDASEYVMAAPEMVALAQDVLAEAELKEAERLAVDLTADEATQDKARERLMALLEPPPKRPIYYAQWRSQLSAVDAKHPALLGRLC